MYVFILLAPPRIQLALADNGAVVDECWYSELFLGVGALAFVAVPAAEPYVPKLRFFWLVSDLACNA